MFKEFYCLLGEVVLEVIRRALDVSECNVLCALVGAKIGCRPLKLFGRFCLIQRGWRFAMHWSISPKQMRRGMQVCPSETFARVHGYIAGANLFQHPVTRSVPDSSI